MEDRSDRKTTRSGPVADAGITWMERSSDEQRREKFVRRAAEREIWEWEMRRERWREAEQREMWSERESERNEEHGRRERETVFSFSSLGMGREQRRMPKLESNVKPVVWESESGKRWANCTV